MTALRKHIPKQEVQATKKAGEQCFLHFTQLGDISKEIGSALV
jgi:hypothetical protein